MSQFIQHEKGVHIRNLKSIETDDGSHLILGVQDDPTLPTDSSHKLVTEHAVKGLVETSIDEEAGETEVDFAGIWAAPLTKSITWYRTKKRVTLMVPLTRTASAVSVNTITSDPLPAELWPVVDAEVAVHTEGVRDFGAAIISSTTGIITVYKGAALADVWAGDGSSEGFFPFCITYIVA